jgi:hypothetical protein
MRTVIGPSALRIDRVSQRRDIGDVAMLEVHALAKLRRELCGGIVGDVDESDLGALRREAAHDCFPDPACAA